MKPPAPVTSTLLVGIPFTFRSATWPDYLASNQQYHSVILELSGSRASRADEKCGMRARKRVSTGESGLTLLELIIASTILLILTSAALPVLKFTVIRAKEAELHRDLRSEEHTSELQSRQYLVCRLLLEKKKKKHTTLTTVV